MKKSCFCLLATVLLAFMAKADTTMTYSGNLPTAQTVLFQNASLLALKGMSLDIQNTFGSILRYYSLSDFRENGDTESGIYLYENNGTIATAQFQWANGYNTTLSSAYFYGLKLRLVQVGNDIQGCVEKVVYNTSNKQYGVDITDMGPGGCSYKEEDLDSLENHNGFFTSCKNLVLTFAATDSHTVTFVDWNGTILDTQTVAFGSDATPPANPSRSGYVFAGWDTAFTAVTENLTVTAVYHQLFTVTFRDADGTVIDTQTVEETTAATAPDMTGRTYGGNPFSGWDADFSSISGDLTVTAVYAVTPADVAAVIDGGELPEGALVWGGGASGTWNDTTANWYNLNKVTRPWSAGAVAVFPCAASVTVSGPKQVGGIIVAGDGDVVLTGDAVEFAPTANVEFYTDGKLRFENGVTGSAGFVQKVRDAHDIFVPGTAYDDEIDGNLTSEPQLLFSGVSLSDIEYIQGEMTGEFGNARKTLTLSSSATATSDGGVFFYDNDGSTLTAQFQVKSHSSCRNCIKVQLVQHGSDIYGQIAYEKSGYTNSNNPPPNIGDNWDDYTVNGYKQTICDLKIGVPDTTIYDVLPTDVSVEIAGDYAVTGTLLVSNGVFRTVGSGTLGGGKAFAEAVRVANGSTLAFASAANQNFGSEVKTLTGSDKGSLAFESGCNVTLNTSAEARRIYLPVSVRGNLTLPNSSSVYHVFYSSPGVDVYDGGVMKIGQGYLHYGHREAKITCHKGGIVQYTAVPALGGADAFIAIDGGELRLCDDYSAKPGDDTATKLMALSNGAAVNGGMMTWAWSRTTNAIAVRGTSPSYFNASLVRFGQNNEVAASNKKMIQQLAVEDVTGDDGADFTVAAKLFLNPNTTWARENEEFCGIEKTGAGTVLFTSADSLLAGSLKVKAGTVAFGDDANLSGMSLWLQGGTVDFGNSKGSAFDRIKLDEDSFITVDAKSIVTFADSSDMAWTADKTLVFSGTMGRKSVRVGTSAAALTADQLAAVKFKTASGKLRAMTIDAKGYLVPPAAGMSVYMR